MHLAAFVLVTGSVVNFAPPLVGVVAGQERPKPVIDVSGGWAGFIDDSVIHHSVLGGAARFYLTPRLSIGPEIVYMIGPATDRDLFVTGNLTYEWPMVVRGQSPRVTPFVFAGGGYMRHQSQFSRSIVGDTGACVGGAGVRLRITDRVHAGPEFRSGLELHFRIGGVATIQLGG